MRLYGSLETVFVVFLMWLVLIDCKGMVSTKTRGDELQLKISPSTISEEGRDIVEEKISRSFESIVHQQESILGYTFTNFSSSLSSIRINNEYSAVDCHCPYIVRERVYLYGALAGLTTLDMKSYQSRSEQQAFDEPFGPAPSVVVYLQSSSSDNDDSEDARKRMESVQKVDQDVERDVHPCRSDFAATSRYYLSSPPSLKTCADLLWWFPYSSPLSHTSALSRKPDLLAPNYAWLSKREGQLGSGASYDITTEIHYKSISNAREGKKPRTSEWSITITNYTQEEQRMIYSAYISLLELYGDPELEHHDIHCSLATFFPPSAHHSSFPLDANALVYFSLVLSIVFACACWLFVIQRWARRRHNQAGPDASVSAVEMEVLHVEESELEEEDLEDGEL